MIGLKNRSAFLCAFCRWIALGAAAVFLVSNLRGQQTEPLFSTDSLQSYVALVQANPPERYRDLIKTRLEFRRLIQRRSYAAILHGVIVGDSFSGILAAMRMNIQLEFSLPHNMLFWVVPPDPVFNTPGIPFEEDWIFPTDPWKRW